MKHTMLKRMGAVCVALIVGVTVSGCFLLPEKKIEYSTATPDPRFAEFVEPLHVPLEIKTDTEGITRRMPTVHPTKAIYSGAYRNGPRDLLNELGNSYWFHAVMTVDQETLDRIKTLDNEGVIKLPGILPELQGHVPQECTFSFGVQNFSSATELLVDFERPFAINELAVSEDCSMVILRGEGE